MPKFTGGRQPPEGWDEIKPVIDELERKMRDVENEHHEGKRKSESLWGVFRVHHQRSRYIYDLYYKRKAISKELYEYCLKIGVADANLIAKWKKPGYERLCCLQCIQQKNTNFSTVCICRVPKDNLLIENCADDEKEDGIKGKNKEKIVECIHCGCKGCSG